ncbi:maltose alpha-D-glucosyltransferase/alpha-amylase [Amycolatopsis bartoniae]|uniref:Alpha-amylase n=1 Tax=Amycolatopsis bartoniae TaxID=941986 RepID=A0A8H9J1I5_9PSEU|nr:alpha-amylase family glycosyl hydrolase [Amycolatopsis bartoniae]MBB2939392.1 maltose alpha-D-glucosyltransferase/alpha-amylase [Amycolatopsis bartoniae]TVT06687.1 oligo-1,6-glucosidase [Amycolatopsis bartoniae]GHF83351.1 alpha-amylase [Amycolatopsis bartoniae]
MVLSRRSFVLGTGAALAGAALLPATPASAASRSSSWLADAVLYQVYPQSFADTGGDGIGDLAGIIDHLDHLRWLGVDTVWVNPVFPSPFTDAGYDISDYVSVHPRYGDEEDVSRLVEAARRRGIRVLFDLVAGHTSDQHRWFLNSLRDPADDRYIWATPDQLPAGGPLPEQFVASPGPRPGAFRMNYYATQPAINYGYARQNADEPWREPVDADGPRANRAAIRSIVDHWLRLGISGFRCDMAATLVKDDPGWVETGKLWGELRSWMDRRHPGTVLISEWGDPATSVPAGFDGDFYLPVNGPGDGAPWRSLWRDDPYFDASGTGTAKTFVDAWTAATKAIGSGGHTIMPIANHDSATRLNNGIRTPEQFPAAWTFLLTWPTVPTIYYGEEIGMRAVEGLPDVEGSAGRQNNRTPMQWNSGPNAGFSSAPAEELYIPLDPDPARPTVEQQLGDPDSLLHFVRRLLALRKRHPELGTRTAVQVFDDGYPLTYLRGDRFLVTVNPRRDTATTSVPDARLRHARMAEGRGVRIEGATVTVEGFGYAVLDLGR